MERCEQAQDELKPMEEAAQGAAGRTEKRRDGEEEGGQVSANHLNSGATICIAT